MPPASLVHLCGQASNAVSSGSESSPSRSRIMLSTSSVRPRGDGPAEERRSSADPSEAPGRDRAPEQAPSGHLPMHRDLRPVRGPSAAHRHSRRWRGGGPASKEDGPGVRRMANGRTGRRGSSLAPPSIRAGSRTPPGRIPQKLASSSTISQSRRRSTSMSGSTAPSKSERWMIPGWAWRYLVGTVMLTEGLPVS